MPKYPNITVKLTGVNGNAFMLIGTVQKALRQNNVPKAESDLFMEEAMAGDYDNVIQTCLKWVEVE